MQLTKNDIVTVLDRSHKEWWKVQRGMKKGMVPANYLKPVTVAYPSTVGIIATAVTTLTNDPWERDRREFQLKKKLGRSGQFGDVWLGLWNEYDKIYTS